MAGLLRRCSGALAQRCPARQRLDSCAPKRAVAAWSAQEDGGKECSANVEVGTLRKGFGTPRRSSRPPPKPQQAAQVLNGRDKAEVTRQVMQEAVKGLTERDDDEWRRVDAKVNTYPSKRLFTAVGSGGDDFRGSMVAAVEAALGLAVAPGEVVVVPSSGGKYVSVRVGPVPVQSGEEVLAVFDKMREDKRLKFHL